MYEIYHLYFVERKKTCDHHNRFRKKYMIEFNTHSDEDNLNTLERGNLAKHAYMKTTVNRILDGQC